MALAMIPDPPTCGTKALHKRLGVGRDWQLVDDPARSPRWETGTLYTRSRSLSPLLFPSLFLSHTLFSLSLASSPMPSLFSGLALPRADGCPLGPSAVVHLLTPGLRRPQLALPRRGSFTVYKSVN